MKRQLFTLCSFTLLALATPVLAAEKPVIMPMDGKAIEQSHSGKGKVNTVDAKSGKVNITHEPIASLDWPGMTMDFEVADKTLLANLKPGQNIDFELVEVHKGKYAISKIKVAK